jgi:hypothetical protein
VAIPAARCSSRPPVKSKTNPNGSKLTRISVHRLNNKGLKVGFFAGFHLVTQFGKNGGQFESNRIVRWRIEREKFNESQRLF